MTAHNPAMSFWPLERQLDGGPPVSNADCREMLIEARRLAAIEREAMADTDAALARVRDRVKARVAHMSHAMQIADARHAARREAGG